LRLAKILDFGLQPLSPGAVDANQDCGASDGKETMPGKRSSPLLADYEGQHPAFDPAVMRMIEKVVDAAWQELVRQGSPLATGRGERIVRLAMARRVFSQVGHGELDPDRLKQYAIVGFLDPLGEWS
jgi:hypothetical protein